MRTFIIAAVLALVALLRSQEPELHTFKRIQLSDQFWSEGANVGDLNNDGIKDVISGPWWWQGPDFTKRHEYYPASATFQVKLGPMTTLTVPGFEGALGQENKYSDNFLAWVHDFNTDSWNDILIVGFPGTVTSWFENPKGAGTHWRRHDVFRQTDNESPTFADLTGDGKPELICITAGRYGYAQPDWAAPSKPWTFHPLSPDNKYGKFTHGMGLGDVNGDGRLDLLEKNGWWEQPASLTGDPVWRFHAQPFGAGGSQMYAYDVNGDGLSDIITALEAHAFGLAWYEQYRDGSDIRFRQHVIMNKEPKDNKYGVKFSELHAIDLADIDGDGLKDIVTGKRFWSHGRTGDPDRNDSAVLYWFKLARHADRSVDFIPHRIDDNSGVGTQVVATDVNGDGLPDIVVGNKKGTFVHLNQKAQLRAAERPFLTSELIFPLEHWHNHASMVVELPNGDLLTCWFHGSGERTADDVVVRGARLKRGTTQWSTPFLMADTPGYPDTNATMFLDPRQRLWLLWPTILANEWHTALMKYRISSNYSADGAPKWDVNDVLHVTPGDEFPQAVNADADRMLAAAPQDAPRAAYLEKRKKDAADKLSRRLGWMTRAHPYVLDGARLIVPLYSDGFDFSLMAITDDWGVTWKTSTPLVGPGNIQPTIAKKKNGTLVAYMRDNGPAPKRLMMSRSTDRGETWSPVEDSELPNPGAGAEVLVLKNGNWVLIYNDLERDRYRLAVSLSEDEGKTWRWTKYLERDAETADAQRRGQYHYPSIIQAADGSLHATYSYFVPQAVAQKDTEGRLARKSIKHAHFNEAWIRQNP